MPTLDAYRNVLDEITNMLNRASSIRRFIDMGVLDCVAINHNTIGGVSIAYFTSRASAREAMKRMFETEIVAIEKRVSELADKYGFDIETR